MVCEFLQGLMAPRCGAREALPIPNMVEEILYCLGSGKRGCPHYRVAIAEGRLPRAVSERGAGLDEPLGP